VNLLAFIASLVHTLAWPLVALIIVILLRDEVKASFGRIKEARVNSRGVVFKLEGADKILKDSRRELQPPQLVEEGFTVKQLAALPSSRKVLVAREEPEPLALTDVKSSPIPVPSSEGIDSSVEIELAWKNLKRKILSAARDAGLKGARSTGPAIAHLSEHGLIPLQFSDTFEKVQAVRDVLRHHLGKQIDPSLVQEFLATCAQLESYVS
jgi:hypothetical protein